MVAPRFALVLYVIVVSILLLYALSYAPMSGVSEATLSAANVISPSALFLMRCAMLSLNLLSIVDQMRRSESKVVVHMQGTGLQPKVKVNLSGYVWLTFFTMQAWLLQTAYLTGVTAVSASAQGVFTLPPLPAWLPIALWVAYEISFSVAILTSFLVKFVIIPTTASKGEPVENFFTFSNLMMHNCNTLFMALELLFNGMELQILHFPLAALWGLIYVLFSWVWMNISGVCWYDFLDPTLPKACIVHTMLILVLGVFFAIGAGIDKCAATLSSPYIRIVAVLIGVGSVARTGFLTGIPQPRKVNAKE